MSLLQFLLVSFMRKNWSFLRSEPGAFLVNLRLETGLYQRRLVLLIQRYCTVSVVYRFKILLVCVCQSLIGFRGLIGIRKLCGNQ